MSKTIGLEPIEEIPEIFPVLRVCQEQEKTRIGFDYGASREG